MTRTIRLLTCIVLSGSAPTHVLGQTGAPIDLSTATIEDLMKVVITTASKEPEATGAAPARVQVVTAAQIARRGYRSLLEVLKDLPDFKVDLGGDPDYPAEVTVRGTRGLSRLIVLLDGIRISSPTNEPLPIVANYPVHNARQVEIVYGPASALYGADAFSAIINIVSKDVTEAPGVTVGSSIGQSGLYNQTASYGVRMGANISLMLSGQFLYDHQPDLSRVYPNEFRGLQGQQTGTFNTIFGPMTSQRPVSPAYDVPLSAHSVQARLLLGGFVFSLFESRSRTSTTQAYTPDNGVYNPEAFNGNNLLVGSGVYTRRMGRVTSVSTLMVSRHQLDPQSGYWNVFSNLAKSYKYAYGSMAKVEEQLSWKPVPSILMTTGATVERFFAIPQGADLNAPVRSQHEPGTILGTDIVDDFVKLRYANTGVFAQMRYTMTPRAILTIGARSDYNTRFGGTFNPRASLVMQPTDSTTVKALYGTAFLAPSPFQSHTHYGSFYSVDGGQTFASSYWHLPNPDLKPQHQQTAEVEVLHAVGHTVLLSGSLFVSRFTDLIKSTDADQSYAGFYHGWPVDYIDFAVNEGRSSTYGGSLGIDYTRIFVGGRRLEAYARAAYVDGRERNEQENTNLPIGAMSPVRLQVGADLDWGAWSVAPRLSVVGAQRLLATTDVAGSLERRTLDGYGTVDVHIRRNVLKGLDAFVTLENLFDRRYRTINIRAYTNPEELIGAPQNPRRVSVGLNLRLR